MRPEVALISEAVSPIVRPSTATGSSLSGYHRPSIRIERPQSGICGMIGDQACWPSYLCVSLLHLGSLLPLVSSTAESGLNAANNQNQ